MSVETPDGAFEIEADWLIVADGARSNVRRQLGLDIEGHVFKDRFLIADVIMEADYPAERWFWFDPPFHPNQTVLLHKQSDNVWRIDFQLGWDADPEREKKPENVIPRIQAMLGAKLPICLLRARQRRFGHQLRGASHDAHTRSPRIPVSAGTRISVGASRSMIPVCPNSRRKPTGSSAPGTADHFFCSSSTGRTATISAPPQA